MRPTGGYVYYAHARNHHLIYDSGSSFYSLYTAWLAIYDGVENSRQTECVISSYILYSRTPGLLNHFLVVPLGEKKLSVK